MAQLEDGAPRMVYFGDVLPRPGIFKAWEHHRHRQAHWFVECFAEFLGVWFYVWCGLGSTAAFVIGNLTEQPGLSSLFQIGFAYAIGIALAILVCAPTSGGHFNPSVTIAMATFRGFPWRKVPQFVLSQILGAFVAAWMVYLQYHDTVKDLEQLLISKGTFDTVMFTPNGPAGIFALYPQPGKPLGFIFANEFFIDTVLAIAVWTIIDPTNFFVPPAAAPWVIGFAYAAAIWGYAPASMSANSARDVGTRLMALCVWGKPAAGGPYAAIAALTNIPATILGALIYEVMLTDSSRVLPPASRDFLVGHRAHLHRKNGHEDHHSLGSASRSDEEKPEMQFRE